MEKKGKGYIKGIHLLYIRVHKRIYKKEKDIQKGKTF